MDAVIGTNDFLGTLFNQIAHLKYAVEEFFTFNPKLKGVIPYGEMLACDPTDGTRKGYLFDVARKCDQTVPANLKALKGAINQHLSSDKSSSINLDVETFFSPQLVVTLDQLKGKNPRLDPTRIWLEMTEQGGVPNNTNVEALESLQDRGYQLALDDFGLDNPLEQVRLDAFGKHVAAVKLDHTYADKFRFGTQEKQGQLGEKIHAIKDRFPGMIIVLEGVRGTDAELFPTLAKAGVDVVQQSGYMNDGPMKPINQREMEFALRRN